MKLSSTMHHTFISLAVLMAMTPCFTGVGAVRACPCSFARRLFHDDDVVVVV
jgi:hypothetical protein